MDDSVTGEVGALAAAAPVVDVIEPQAAPLVHTHPAVTFDAAVVGGQAQPEPGALADVDARVRRLERRLAEVERAAGIAPAQEF